MDGMTFAPKLHLVFLLGDFLVETDLFVILHFNRDHQHLKVRRLPRRIDLKTHLLEGSEILTSLGEFTFLHSFTDEPVNESTLAVEKIELVVESTPSTGDSSGVGKHAQRPRDLGEITTWDVGGRLVADTELETGRAPVDEADGSLGFDGSDGGIAVFGDDVTSVCKASRTIRTIIADADGLSRLTCRGERKPCTCPVEDRT